MDLSTIDWSVIIAFFAIIIGIGIYVGRSSGSSSTAYFLSNRNMPWWLLGFSMVATTFSADTPNLVTDIIRKDGLAGNWVWWAFLLTGMLTVFVYAKLWRRSGIVTDLEFYELRYSGDAATFLRGFRAIYLGVFFNVMIMAAVMLAGIKMGGILLGWSAMKTVLILSLVTMIFSTLGGFRGVVVTDFFQFILSMGGMIAACIYIVGLPEVGGLDNLLSNTAVSEKTNFFPDFDDKDVLIPLFIMPIAVQWWNVWYPGAEPGGGGYIAQRMLSAKDEKNAVFATLFFNFAHYALRPWPWILIAFASIIVFPTVQDIGTAFPAMDPDLVKDDLAFPAMLSFLPAGLLGLVIAALLAALMSTLSTHLNWGASYVVNDFYQRFLNKEASQTELVNVGRLSTIVLMILSALFALALSNALQAFNILLQIGAGTGLIFILRWFWWRINAISEIVAMIVSFLVALYFEFGYAGSMEAWQKLLVGIGITSASWIIATLVTPPTARATLINFYKLIKPHAAGWKPVVDEAISSGALEESDIGTGSLSREILMMLLGCFAIYGVLFITGYIIMGNMSGILAAGAMIMVTGILLMKMMRKSY